MKKLSCITGERLEKKKTKNDVFNVFEILTKKCVFGTRFILKISINRSLFGFAPTLVVKVTNICARGGCFCLQTYFNFLTSRF